MTTPNQRRPDGAYSVGGGEFRFGQQVDESVITDLFQIDIPSKSELSGIGIRDALTGDFDVASGYLGRALGMIPFESLKQFERFVLEPTEEDPAPTFADQEDGINKILESFGLKSETGPLGDLWDKIRALIQQILQGRTDGDVVDVGDKIREMLDNIQENIETLNGISTPGNHLISPNFEFTTIKRLPFGGGTVEYSTEQSKLTQKSLKLIKTSGSEQGVFFAPTQRQTWMYAFPAHTYTAGCFVKGKSTNTDTGTVRLVLRWLDKNNATISETSSVLLNQSAIKADWVELEVSGEAPANTARMEVFLASSASSPVGTAVYVDAGQVREYTFVQKVVDNIHEAIDGAIAARNERIETVKTKLQTAWGKFVDGLRGNTAGTTAAALPADVYTAAAEVASTSETALTNADTAQDTADAATTTVNDVQNTVIMQARDYTNIAGGSDFTAKDPNTGDWIHPWELTSRYAVSTAHFDGHPTSRSGANGAALWSQRAGISGVANLKAHPSAQEGEQFYIEFYVMRDGYYNGTDSLSRLRIGYNDDDIYLDSIPFGASRIPYPYQWEIFGKTITVPAGVQFLNFSISTDHSSTNSAIETVTGPLGSFVMPIGSLGKLAFDEITIRRVIPADGIEPLPKSHVNDLELNLAALAVYRGANLLGDPGFEHGYPLPEVSGYDGTSYATTPVRTGSQSVKLAPGTLGWSRLPVPLAPLAEDRGSGFPVNGLVDLIPCTTSDVFYVEGYVYGKSANTYPTLGDGFQVGMWPLNAAGTPLTAQQVSGTFVTTACNGNWHRVSGYFNGYTGATSFYIGLEGKGPDGHEWWVDDFALYRVTESREAQLTAEQAASDIQETVDNIHQAVNGGTDTGNSLVSVKTNVALVKAAASEAVDNTNTLTDNVSGALSGDTTVSGATLSDALTALDTTFKTLANHSQKLNELQTKKESSIITGTSVSINFSDYADGAMPSDWDVTYTGAGTGNTIAISNGLACWVGGQNADRDAKIIWNRSGSEVTNSDYQILRGTMSTAPQAAPGGGTAPKFHAMGRVSADKNTFVWARAYCTGILTYKGEIGCTVSGTEYVWSSNIPLTWSLDMTFKVGVGSNARQYQVWSGNTMVWQHTETGSTSSSGNTSTSPVQSSLGASYRRWGALAQIRGGTGGPKISGKVGGSSVYDNAPVTKNGSIARMYRTGGSTTFTAGDTALTSWFDNIEYECLDIDADTTTGQFTITSGTASKAYYIVGRVQYGGGVGAQSGVLYLQVSTDGGSSWTSIGGGSGSNVIVDSAVGGSWIQYLNAGDKVRLMARNNGSNAVNGLTGGANDTYFSICATG